MHTTLRLRLESGNTQLEYYKLILKKRTIMTLANIYYWRNSTSLNNTKLSISAERNANSTDLAQVDLEAKLREEATWLGIG